MIVDLDGPDLLARVGVDGVGEGALVSEEGGVTATAVGALVFADRDRGSDPGLRVE